MKKLSILKLSAGVLLISSGAANAVVDPAITAAIATATTDAATVGSLIFVFILGIAIFKHMRSVK